MKLRREVSPKSTNGNLNKRSAGVAKRPPRGQPVWDSERRELRVGGAVVKRFRQPARSQEAILAAFQEEGWPPHIDNPLPSHDDVDAIDRLHGAIRRLNDQTNHMIRFESDGRAEGSTS